MTQPTSDKSQLLADLSPYIYGTTRLGDDKIPFDERVKVARAAMDSGVWFHTSHTYGDTLKVLRAAFDQDRTRVPKLIVKIGWGRTDELRNVIHQNIDPLGLESLELGQLCLSGFLAKEFMNGGECYKEFERIKAWSSNIALHGIRGGYSDGVLDGYIFYLNPLQRFAPNELWDLLVERNEPVVAMRTVSGGNVHRLRDIPGAAWKPYLQQRAVEVAPIFERSGIASWTEFCVRFAFGFPQVRATVGATSHVENLQEFLNATKNIQPLSEDIQNELIRLQYRWSDEVDMKADHWSM